MPHPPLRIAILECDTPLDNTRAKYGGYGGVFTTLLTTAAASLCASDPSLPAPSQLLQLTSHHIVTSADNPGSSDPYPKIDSIDAILITGSRYNSFDEDPWIVSLVDFTKQVLAQDRVRVIGVCFGHQIVGRAMGVPVGRSPGGWEISVMRVELTEKGKEVFGCNDLALHQMHRDAILSPPDTTPFAALPPTSLASTGACPVQSLYIPHRLITIQGHPEFDEEIVTEVLVARHAMGIFDDAMFEDGISRVSKSHDGVLVARAFLRFLIE